MAILPILTYGASILRKRAEPVSRVDKAVRQLMEDMVDTMLDAPGLGLAAPQVGRGRRVVVARLDDEVFTLANPKVLESEGAEESWEACLSLPGLQGLVSRPTRVVVSALNEAGRPVKLEATGLAARCLSHEIDHVDGIVFPDHCSDDGLRWVYEAGRNPDTGAPLYEYEYVTREQAFQELVRRWRKAQAARRAVAKG